MRDLQAILRERLLSPVHPDLQAGNPGKGSAGAPVELVEVGAAVLEEHGELRIGWGYAPGPVGQCSIGWFGPGICHLAFEGKQADLPGSLRAAWPRAEFQRDDASARKLAGRVFAADRSAGKPLRVVVRGTRFQLKVWRSLLEIPRGHVATYGMVARAIGAPNAARAVGTACGANRIAYVIPCHRVVHGNGSALGYRWGADKKAALLEQELASGGRSK